jgi:hypothetical protein
VFLFELSDEVDAQIDPVRFKVEEIESAAIIRSVELSSEIDKLRKCSTNLPSPNAMSVMLSSGVATELSARPLDCGGGGKPVAVRGRENKILTHIDSHMAHNACMMWKSNILVFVVYALCIDGTFGSWFVVDDECARDIDFDGAGIGDCSFQTVRALASIYLHTFGHDGML